MRQTIFLSPGSLLIEDRTLKKTASHSGMHHVVMRNAGKWIRIEQPKLQPPTTHSTGKGKELDRRTFLGISAAALALGAIPACPSRHKPMDMLIGDSMIHFWKWHRDHEKISKPAVTVAYITRLCKEHIDSGRVQKARTILVWAGTADCAIPLTCILPDDTISVERYKNLVNEVGLAGMEQRVNSDEKLQKVFEDMIGLAGYIKEHFAYERFRIISPFPHRSSPPEMEHVSPQTFSITGSLNERLRSEFGREYIDLRRFFYDLSTKSILDDKREMFFDNVHINARGYDAAREILKRVYDVD